MRISVERNWNCLSDGTKEHLGVYGVEDIPAFLYSVVILRITLLLE